jgi:hypothetical protein
VDQIRIPISVAASIFDGLHEEGRGIVLVNRNPTLHKKSLLALRPVIDATDEPVFAMPLGLLGGMGADFDGDQVSIVALEHDRSRKAAERLLPGSNDLRTDPFRKRTSAFPLIGELADSERDFEIATQDCKFDQAAWCQGHAASQQERLNHLGDGWNLIERSPGWRKRRERVDPLWKGELSESEWLKQAHVDMQSVYLGVRRKGRYGGILRRELYSRIFRDLSQFYVAVDVLSTITERIVQRALNVKQGDIPIRMDEIEEFFKKPDSSLLAKLDDTFEGSSLIENLGEPLAPRGPLALLARPSLNTVLDLTLSGEAATVDAADPRWAWFFS